jgi:hypothetical protein
VRRAPLVVCRTFGPGLFETIPGDPVIVVGNGMDSVGYLVPSYDFVVDPVYNVFVESTGEHYEESVSVGDVDGIIRATIEALSDALGFD